MADDWRARDLRGDDEGPSGSVTAVVRHARRSLLAARAGEAALFGIAALCLTLSASTFGGAGIERADAWVAGGVSALAAGLAWWIEHRRSRDDVARALDRRLRHQGALITAYEVERSGEPSPMGPLVVAHVLRRLRRREAVRAVRPGLALPVAVPLFGAAALATAIQDARVEVPPPAAAAVSEGLVGTITGTLRGALEDEGVDLGLVHDLRAVAADARALADGLEDRGGEPDADDAARVEELDRKLAELQRRAVDQPELRAALHEARSYLDALRPKPGDAAQEPAGPREGPRTAEAGADPPGGAAGVTGAAGDGTMSGSASAGEVDPSASGTAPDAGAEPGDAPVGLGVAETAAGADAWWPAEHDEIVRLWVERARAGD